MSKILTSLILISIIISCSNNTDNITTKTSDYSDKNNWLNIAENQNEREADVFYLYPTTWSRENTNEDMICSIDSPSMRRYTTNVMIEQTGIFEEIASIYAPFYRQADAIYLLDKNNNISEEEKNKYFYSAPKEDAIAAFDYYIKNYNNGRPFILAGHSQGAMMIKQILIDYFKTNENLKNRMIAVYIFGYSVTKKDLEENPHLRFANNEYDTGVIISYNTDAVVPVGGTSASVALFVNGVSYAGQTSTQTATAGSTVNLSGTAVVVLGLAQTVSLRNTGALSTNFSNTALSIVKLN